MEKATQFLEKNVEWIVLGLAVLFLGYMAYTQVLQAPHVVEINNKTVEPGEINAEIVKGPAQRLKADIAKPPPDIEVNDFVTGFFQRMNFQTPQYAQAFEPLNQALFPGGHRVQPLKTDPDRPPTETVAIAAVPTLPPPTKIETASDRMVAKIVNEDAKQPAKQGRRRNVKAADDAVEKDIDWVTTGGLIKAEDLQKAFDKPFKVDDAPETLWETKFLRVEMQREELMPDGSWGNQKNIEPLEIHKMKPFPGPDATEGERLEYLDWVDRSSPPITTPAFYEWSKGPQWFAPGTERPSLTRSVGGRGAASRRFDPSNPPKRKLTREEKRQVDEHKRMQREMRRNRGGGGGLVPPGMVPPGTNRSMINFSPPPGMTPQEMRRMQKGGGRYPSPYGPGGFPGMPGGMGLPGMPGGRPAQNFPRPGGGVGAQGTFDVASLQDDLQIWAHDDAPVPGRTYRYRLRYRLLNPLHQATNVKTDSKFKEQLALTSEWSAWSDPVRVSDRVNFWLAGRPTNRDAEFEVFRWTDGEWKSRTEKAAPGDVIGQTDWMLVDLRKSPRGGEVHVLLVNKNGELDRRDVRRDENDPERIKLQEQVEMTAASAGAR